MRTFNIHEAKTQLSRLIEQQARPWAFRFSGGCKGAAGQRLSRIGYYR
ncbi:MAG TPA: hypothetical protein VIE65_09875 [Methylobacter sp.]